MVFGKDINVTEHKRLNLKSVIINFKIAIYSYVLVNYKLNQKCFFFFLPLCSYWLKHPYLLGSSPYHLQY